MRAQWAGRSLVATAVICLPLAGPAAAQDDAGSTAKRPMVSRNMAPSPNAMVNMINQLVKQGVFTEEQGAALIKQAEDEAYVARQALSAAATKADDATKTATNTANAVSPPGTKRVTYVPEIVKQQLREDIKKEVMVKAQQEGWASPGTYPEWARRIRFYGDARVRYEADVFPKGNNPLTAINYNAINTGSPYDTGDANKIPWPTYDVDQNRNRARLRARLGMDADLFEGFSAGLRIATGDGNSPISFNSTLGGSGGNFSKYGIWLDRAFIKYNAWDELTLQAGRFDNPFFSPTDLVYHRDLGFDGLAARGRYEIWPGISPFVVAGAFPIYNTDFNVGSSVNWSSSNNAVFGKAPSHDKWMFGGQIGANVRLVPEIDFTFGGAYYDFTNVQGRRSSPCPVATTQDFCDTDLTRPSFAQRGNSYMELRNINFNPDVNLGAAGPQALYQYYGLASGFREVVVSGRLDLGHFDPIHIVLDGEYVRNVAWNRDDVAARISASTEPLPAGATASCTSLRCPQQVYVGGNQGYMGRMTVGQREFKERWDWNAFVGYKYLESDAVIDAFTDSDFGLGGTNLKGYFVGGSVALGSSTWLTARWMSANQVAGSPYAVDIFQLDLNAKF